MIENREGDATVFPNSAIGKILRHKGFPIGSILRHLGELYRTAIHAYDKTEEDLGIRPDGTIHKSHPNFLGYKNFVNKFTVENEVNGEIKAETYYIRFTVQETAPSKKKPSDPNHVFHSTFISNIELYEIGESSSQTPILPQAEKNSPLKEGATLSNSRNIDLADGFAPSHDDRLAQWFNSVNPNDVSKIGDENGEPLVVYHGSPSLFGSEFTEFDSDYGRSENGFFFTTSEALAKEYARPHDEDYTETVYAVFLNLRNPLVRDEGGKRKTEFWDEIDEAQRNGHDGMMAQNVVDPRFTDSVNLDPSTTIAVFNPTQIKSATDNVGTFDGGNPDIRYQLSKKEDRAYLDTVERGDMDTAQKMVDAAARKTGYLSVSDYRMNHRAPNREDDSLATIMESGLVPDDYWTTPRYYQYGQEEYESFYAVKHALDRNKQLKAEGKPNVATLRVYRAVPKTVREDKLRNGDWVSPSRAYAKMEGAGIVEGYRIIRMSVPLNQLWWDGNSIAELGYDDGKEYVYQNTKNNRKLIDAVTYDHDGRIIPLSKRFNKREYDPRFQLDVLSKIRNELAAGMAAAELVRGRGNKAAREKAMAIIRRANVRYPDAVMAEAVKGAEVIRGNISEKLTDAALNRAVRDHFGGEKRIRLGTTLWNLAEEGARKRAFVLREAEKMTALMIAKATGTTYSEILVKSGFNFDDILKSLEGVLPMRKEKRSDADGKASEADDEGVLSEDDVALTEEDAAAVQESYVRITAEKKQILERLNQAVARDREAEEARRRKREENQGDDAEEEAAASAEELEEIQREAIRNKKKAELLKKLLSDFGVSLKSPEEAGVLIKLITEDYIRRSGKHAGVLEAGGNLFEHPAILSEYVKTAADISERLMQMYVPSRAQGRVNRRIGRLLGGDWKTEADVDGALLAVTKTLSEDMIRQTRASVMKDVRKALKPYAKHYTQGNKAELKGDSAALTNQWARMVIRAIGLGPTELPRQIALYEAIDSGERAATVSQQAFYDAGYLEILGMYGGMKDKPLAELKDVVDDIKNRLANEQQAFNTRKVAVLAADRALSEDLAASIVPKEGRVNPGELGFIERNLMDVSSGMFNTSVRLLTRFQKDENARAQSIAAGELIELMMSQAENEKQNHERLAGEMIRRAILKHFKSIGEFNRVMNRPLGKELSEKLNRGRQKTQWTMDTALHMWAAIRQSDYAENCLTHGRDGAYFNLLEEVLGRDPRVIDFYREMSGFFDWQFNLLNQKRMETVGLPYAKSQNYSPVQVYIPKRDGAATEARAFRPWASSLSVRVQHGHDIDQNAGFYRLTMLRMKDAAHTLGYAESGETIQRVLLGEKVTTAIQEAFGHRVLEKHTEHVKRVLMGPPRVLPSAEGNMMKELTRATSIFYLWNNIPSALKQTSGFFTAALRIDGMTGLWLKTLRNKEAFGALWRQFIHSKAAIRWNNPVNPAMANARGENRITAGIRSAGGAIIDAGFKPLTWGDQIGAIAVVPVFLQKKTEAMRHGLSEPEAIERAAAYAMMIVDSTAQSNRVMNLSLEQQDARNGIFLQFVSSPRQQLMLGLTAAAELAASPKNSKRWQTFARVFFINHIVVPFWLSAIEAALAGVLGEWDDEDKWKRWWARLFENVMLGPLSGLVFVGAVSSMMAGAFSRNVINEVYERYELEGRKLTGYHGDGGLLPADSFIQALTEIISDGHDAFVLATGDEWEEAKNKWLELILGTLPPLRQAKRFKEGHTDKEALKQQKKESQTALKSAKERRAQRQ